MRRSAKSERACESLARALASRNPEETRKSRRGLGMPLVMGPGRAGMPLDVVRSKSGRSPVCTTAFTGCCCCAASGWSSLSLCKRRHKLNRWTAALMLSLDALCD